MSLLTPNLFPRLLAIRRRTGISRAGAFSFGPVVNIKGRIEVREELKRSFTGEMVTSSHVLYTTTPIARHDVIFLTRALASDIENGLEPMAVWETHAMNNNESLYKVWLNFFG